MRRLITRYLKDLATPLEMERFDPRTLKDLVGKKRMLGFIVDISTDEELVNAVAQFRQEGRHAWIIALKWAEDRTRWLQERRELIPCGFDDLVYIPLNPLDVRAAVII